VLVFHQTHHFPHDVVARSARPTYIGFVGQHGSVALTSTFPEPELATGMW
jgi:hypothetical protein